MRSSLSRGLLVGLLAPLALACGDDDMSEVRFDGPSLDGGVDAAVPEVSCDATRIERCQVGRCIVSAPRTTLLENERVELRELPITTLGGDPLPDSSLCEVVLPERLALEGGAVTLEIELDSAAPADAVLFRSEAGEGMRVAASSARPMSVAGILARSGLYGATRAPGPLSLGATLVGDPQRSDTPAALLRNVSSTFGRGVTWDGTHTYVASGTRVLVYRGMPGPASVPELVLGQPSLDLVVPGISASHLAGVTDVWSDGEKLAIANGHRVSLWRQKPMSSFSPADVVLGQRDFVSNGANAGGLSASSMREPYGIDSDGTRLVVAELRNDRVLSWDHFPTRNGEPATGLIGQNTFVANVAGGAGPIYQAWGVALDGPGAWNASFFAPSFRVADALAIDPPRDFVPLASGLNLGRSTLGYGSAVAVLADGALAFGDSFSHRVAIYRQKPTAPRDFDFALGQPDPARASWHPVSASTLSLAESPQYLRSAAPYLFVGSGPNRTLVYDHTPRYFFEPADRVLGQAGFTTADRGLDTRFVSGRALGYPASVAVSDGRMAIADRGNNRVLLFSTADLAAEDPTASVVIGQLDATSVVPNVDQISPSASTLSGPSTVVFAGGRMIVADTENHRVLVWNTVPSTSGAPADFVLGQADMNGRKPNRNRGDADLDGHSDASLDGFFAPTGLASDGTRLFVTDRIQNRILVWDTFPTTSGQSASRVLGQSAGSQVLANHGQGSFAPQPDGLSLPTALVLDGDSLFVADTENNRVLRWDALGGTPTLGQVYGQPDGSTVTHSNVVLPGNQTAGYPTVAPTTATSVVRPVGLALSATRLYVSERGSNRVHVLDRATGAELVVLGHATSTVGTENDQGVGARSLAGPAGLALDGDTLWIADGNNHRVLGVPAAAATHAEATRRIGQPSWLQNGYARSLPVSAGGSPKPGSLAATADALYVAETNYNRVVVYDRTELAAGLVQRVLGQPDVTSTRPNRGGAPTAGSLSGPRGVFVSELYVFVADTENHRVLIFDRTDPTGNALRVLGQAGFGDASENRGGAVSAASLRRPEAVSFDGTRLYVADTGNHRVLVWNTFPATDGAPADAVLGQADPTGDLGNLGANAASAGSLAGPTALLSDSRGLFVGDTLNNRVLLFAAPFSTGQVAARVFGQSGPSERIPASSVDDLAHGSGPVALASDGASLYVAERDGRRITVYRPDSPDFRAESRIAGTEAPGGGFVSPGGLVLERTPLFTSRLLVSDGERDRVLVLESASRLRAP